MHRFTLALAVALLACTDGNPQYDPDAETDAGVDGPADAAYAFRWAPAYIDADPSVLDAALIGPDFDGDGVRDDLDNCPDVANSDQANTDSDTNGGDACDVCPTMPGDADSHADLDDDGAAACEGDCDDHDRMVRHFTFGGIGDVDERCDGVDNDCNGKVDEGGVCGEVDAGR